MAQKMNLSIEQRVDVVSLSKEQYCCHAIVRKLKLVFVLCKEY